ncbi:MAG: 2-hydroxyacid dehydrogenase [Planctomycetota bacterium]
MKVSVFNTKPYDRQFLGRANGDRHELLFLDPRLMPETAPLADGSEAVCAFVNDDLGRATIERLAEGGVKFVAMRCAGFNNVDLDAAKQHGIRVARVPAYAPAGVAEHAVALMLGLNRRLYRAYNRVREGNFALGGLLGFEMHGKTAGVVGTGKIGAACARILLGFGMKVLAFDTQPSDELTKAGVEYVELDDLLRNSDVITLHVPLMEQTHHMIDRRALGLVRKGVMLINTSRGGLIDTDAAIAGLKDGTLGSLGLDVYEEEDGLFFEDHSSAIMGDDTFARLLTFPNVLITGHQAFFTEEAMTNIAGTTIDNLNAFATDGRSDNEVGGS